MALTIKNIRAYICHSDRIELNGVDIGNQVHAWKLSQEAGGRRMLTLEIFPDDTFKINGRNLDDMLGDPAATTND